MFRLFKRSALPTDKVNTVLAFLPDMEAGSFNRAMGYHRKTGSNLPQVESLRKALLASGLVHGSGWTSFLYNYKRIIAPGGIGSMTPQEVQTLITCILRQDRLSDGLLAWFCQSGLMTVTLRRLKALHDKGEIASVLH